MTKNGERDRKQRSKLNTHQKSAPNNRPLRVSLEAVAVLLFGIGYLIQASGRHTVLVMWVYAAGVSAAAIGAPFPRIFARVATAIALLIAVLLTREHFKSTATRPPTKLPFGLPSPVTLPTAAISTGTPTSVESSQPNPSPTPSTPPTISAEPFSFTPAQIAEKLRAEHLTSLREATADAFKGLKVDWILSFSSAVRLGDSTRMAVFFLEPANDRIFPVVSFKIPLEGNEHFPLTESTKRFRVRGTIEKVDVSEIDLDDDSASFEPVP
jgi:hypothetical protein